MARKTTRRVGQGTVYKRKDGRWEGAVTTGYSETGNPVRARVTRRTQAEAVTALNDLISKHALGVPLTQSNQRLEEFIKSWLETTIKPNRAAKTYRYYEQLTRLYILPAIGHRRLKDVTPQVVQAMLNELSKPRARGSEQLTPLKAHTVNGVRATLRSALSTARKWRLIAENPVSLVSRPQMDHQAAVYLGVDEIRALMSVLPDEPMKNLILLGLSTGLRIGEATGLRWDDVDLEQGLLRIRQQLQFEDGNFVLRPPKSSSARRTLPITPTTVAAICNEQATQQRSIELLNGANELGLVFTTPEGKPLHQKYVDRALKRLCAKAGIQKQISYHKLRHTHGTHLSAAGVPLSVVKDVLGHSQIGVTVNTYGHAVPTALRAAADAFDKLLDLPKSPST